MSSPRALLIIVATAGLMNLVLLFPPSTRIGAIAAYGLLVPVPGVLLTGLLLRKQRPIWPLHLLYGIGAGFGCAVVLMLLLSYLPGGLSRETVLLAADGLIIALAAVSWRCHRLPTSHQTEPLPANTDRIWLGAIALLLTASFFRFTNLGYAEFQGDEARAALRAAAVIQGYEDVLFLHRKGPAEILIPAAPFTLIGLLDETVARMPFTVAGIAGIFAVFALGARLGSPLAGWIAAMLFAVNGYFVGFARILQYQSIVFLMTVLVVLILFDLYRHPRAAAGPLVLASWLLATGLLAHYEVAMAMVPSSVIIIATIRRATIRRQEWTRAIGAAMLVGVAILALFYVPYINHPNFSSTFAYLAGERIGHSVPHNNLLFFSRQTTVYSSSYYLILLVLVTLVGLLMVYRRGFGRWGEWLGVYVAIAIVVAVALAGDRDWAAVPYVLAIAIVWVLPNIDFEERLLWIWFGVASIVGLFVVEKPNTHVYTFILPWLLLVGVILARGWHSARKRFGTGVAIFIGAAAGVALLTLFGNYVYRLFVYTENEVLQDWPNSKPRGYWTPFEELQGFASFGAPHSVGWKAIGMLYADGVLQGAYETTEDVWVPAWYTRGRRRCQRAAQWYLEADERSLRNEAAQQTMERILNRGFSKWGGIDVNGAVRMRVYEQTGSDIDQPNKAAEDDLMRFRSEDYEAAFDRRADWAMPLAHPTVSTEIDLPASFDLGGKVRLEGYSLAYDNPLRPGDVLQLTLFWRAQQAMDRSYRVFNQSYYGNGEMVAQADGYPLCDSFETWRWKPGELIVDTHEIPVHKRAPPGIYPLYTGMYDPETQERLAVRDGNGIEIGTQIHLADIQIATDSP